MEQFDEEFDQNDMFKFKKVKNTNPDLNLKFVYEFSTLCPYCKEFIQHTKEVVFWDHFTECERVNHGTIEDPFVSNYLKMCLEFFHNMLYNYNRYYQLVQPSMGDYEQTLYELDEKVEENKELKECINRLNEKHTAIQGEFKKLSDIFSKTHRKVLKLSSS